MFKYRAHKSREYFLRMFKIGWPMSLQMSTEMLSLFGVAMMVGWIGTQALAAFQVVNQYLFLVIVPIFALSQACGITIGQARGAGNLHEIRNLGYASIRIALVWAAIAVVAFILCPRFLASFYFNIADPVNAQVLHWVIWLFVIVSFSQIFDAVA